ncbi:hypothetical protein PV782_02210 [Prescottella equi]
MVRPGDALVVDVEPEFLVHRHAGGIRPSVVDHHDVRTVVAERPGR